MANTLLKLGWSDPLSDVFGDHPRLGPVVDLNDGVTCTLATPQGLDLPAPPRTLVASGNIRTQGEAATRAIYRHNRRATARILVGPMGSYSDLASNLRTLVAWLNAPPDVACSLQYQPIGASSPVYLDVVGAAHDIPEDEGQWLRLQFEPVEIVFFCRPGLRGDRITLQNLLPNPGFEAPSGPGVTVFADPLTSLNAYTVQAGSAPTSGPSSSYVDAILADAPLRYYRLGLADDASHAYDIAGSGQTGTPVNTPTQQVAGGLTGDTDTCYTFASASGQRITLPSGGTLPTGNTPWTVRARIKFAANPSAIAHIANFGAAATHQMGGIYIDTSGSAHASSFNGDTTAGAALSLNTWHEVVGTWDGTTLKCYVDGAAYGTNATPGNMSIPANPAASIAARVDGTTQYFNGQIDEVTFYGGALAAARIAALSTAAGGVSGTLANAATFATGSRVSFGSPDWSAVNAWALRFRYVTSLAISAYLHYTDANNYLLAQLASGANGFKIVHTIGGVATMVAQATAPLQHEAWYWLQVTQFPGVAGDPPYLSAALNDDAAGAVGALVVGIAGAAADAITALAGQPQLAVAGAGLALGGLASGVGHAVALFGPGAWSFAGNGGTALCCGAWDTATTYPGGLTTSFAAARIDCGPNGSVDARWQLFAGGAVGGSWAAPVKAAGDSLQLGVETKSAGLGAGAMTTLTVAEYDAYGALLRTDTGWMPPSVTGSQASWTRLAGTYVTGADCAYVDLALRVVDATSGSAGGTVWFDNAQLWDATSTGATSMPYCELRFPQAPAQLLVTGLLGDLPAPAQIAFGTYLTDWPAGSSLSFALGRRARADASARLAGASVGGFGATFSPQSAATLDAGSFGGYYVSATVSGGWNPRAFSPKAGDEPGTYHLWGRFLTKQSTGNLGNVQVRAVTVQQGSPWFGQVDQSDYYGQYYGPYAAPLTAANTWTPVDAGQVTLPPFAQGALSDPAQTYVTPRQQWSDATGGGSVCQMGWQVLLPVDGSLLLGTLLNPSNSVIDVAGSWLWAYADPLGAPNGLPPAWTYSLEPAALANPARGAGGPGTTTTGSINVNFGADPYLTLDPQQHLSGGDAFNQIAALLTDGAGAVLPIYAEISYSPLYLYPR